MIKYKLRYNVIKKDWYDGVDIFYCQYGSRPECVEMNYCTFNMFYKYLLKCHDSIVCNREIIHRSGDTIMFSNQFNVYYDNIRIIINNDFEDEIIRFY